MTFRRSRCNGQTVSPRTRLTKVARLQHRLTGAFDRFRRRPVASMPTGRSIPPLGPGRQSLQRPVRLRPALSAGSASWEALAIFWTPAPVELAQACQMCATKVRPVSRMGTMPPGVVFLQHTAANRPACTPSRSISGNGTLSGESPGTGHRSKYGRLASPQHRAFCAEPV
jgi:hypothetical protein